MSARAMVGSQRGSPRGRRGSAGGVTPPVATYSAEDVFRKYSMPGASGPEILRSHVIDALSGMGIDISPADLDRSFRDLGIQSNALSQEQFRSVAQAHEQQNRYSVEDLRQMLATFDTNGDGVLAADEFKKIWARRMTEAEINETMLMADTNMDGVVDMEEWLALMCPGSYQGMLRDDSPQRQEAEGAINASFSEVAAATAEAVGRRTRSEREAAGHGDGKRRRAEALRAAAAAYRDGLAQEDWSSGLRGSAEAYSAALGAGGSDWNALSADHGQRQLGDVQRRLGGGPAPVVITPSLRPAHEVLQRAHQCHKLVAGQHNLLPPGLLPFVEGADWRVEGHDAAADNLRKKWTQEEANRTKLRRAYCAGFFGVPTSSSGSAERAANALGLRRRLDGAALATTGELRLAVGSASQQKQLGLWINADELKSRIGKDPPDPVGLGDFLSGRSVCEMLGAAELPITAAGAGTFKVWVCCTAALACDAGRLSVSQSSSPARSPPPRSSVGPDATEAKAACLRQGGCGFSCDPKGNLVSVAVDAQGTPCTTPSQVAALIRPAEEGDAATHVWVCLVLSAADASAIRAFDSAFDSVGRGAGSRSNSPTGASTSFRGASSSGSIRSDRSGGDGALAGRDAWAHACGCSAREAILTGSLGAKGARGALAGKPLCHDGQGHLHEDAAAELCTMATDQRRKLFPQPEFILEMFEPRDDVSRGEAGERVVLQDLMLGHHRLNTGEEQARAAVAAEEEAERAELRRRLESEKPRPKPPPPAPAPAPAPAPKPAAAPPAKKEKKGCC